MNKFLPKPKEVGIEVPKTVKKERYEAGFEHAVSGGQITEVEHLRLSFRLGFRAGKLFLREERNRRGIIEFPFKGKFNFKAK